MNDYFLLCSAMFGFIGGFVVGHMSRRIERAYLRGYRQAAWDHKHAGGFDKYNLEETS